MSLQSPGRFAGKKLVVPSPSDNKAAFLLPSRTAGRGWEGLITEYPRKARLRHAKARIHGKTEFLPPGGTGRDISAVNKPYHTA